jgi:hypothetical protein
MVAFESSNTARDFSAGRPPPGTMLSEEDLEHLSGDLRVMRPEVVTRFRCKQRSRAAKFG